MGQLLNTLTNILHFPTKKKKSHIAFVKDNSFKKIHITTVKLQINKQFKRRNVTGKFKAKEYSEEMLVEALFTACK